MAGRTRGGGGRTVLRGAGLALLAPEPTHHRTASKDSSTSAKQHDQKPILLPGLVDILFQANALTIQALSSDRQSLIILVFDMWSFSFVTLRIAS